MKTKTIVIVEDEEEQRVPLQKALERRGFRVGGAGTVAEAYKVIEELGEAIDVMVLDMKLDDPYARNTTGADIAIEIRDRHPNWMPEYLITTVHQNVMNYYRLALRLGAAAFLAKDEVNRDDTVRHIRALALKRSLRIERPSVMAELSAISDSTKNLSEAVQKFCREMLAGELNACLGSPYALLLTDERGTQNVATNTDLPTMYESSYFSIQALAHAITKLSSLYVISKQDMDDLPPPANAVEERVFARLPGATLLPLANVMNFRLSLALFVPQPGESKYPEDTGQLAAGLAQHVRPSIVEHFLGILVHLESQKKAMLKSISYFCLYLGQDQQRIIEEGVTRRELQEESATHQNLQTMADDLWQTGTILNNAANSLSKDALPILEMRNLIESEFADLRDAMSLDELSFKLDGSCRVKAGDDIRVAVKRLLHWLAQLHTETPPSVKPEIYVQCIEREDSSLIVFEDRSPRLSAKLREQLFEPFSTSVVLSTGAGDAGPGLYLPLYLAKVLVEEKYGGTLHDESDKMSGEIGHRLVMRLSPPGDQVL
jgi:ActR/RegA family two-component response regulator/signal transduction histidine kinase